MGCLCCLFLRENTQQHDSINHSENFVNPQNRQVHTQTIENLWGILKKWLNNNQYTIRANFELYLAEFVVRRNFRNLTKVELLNLFIGF